MSASIAAAKVSAPQAQAARMFAWVGMSQLLSLTGAALTEFGLGVWILQQTGSVLTYTLLVACIAAPALVVAPWVGAWVDRLDGRWVMVAAACGSAVCSASAGMLFWSGHLHVAAIFLLVAMSAVCQGFQRPALLAAMTTALPKHMLAKASGWTQLTFAMPWLVGPLAAAFLIGPIGLGGIITLDLLFFSAAMVVRLASRFPRTGAPAKPADSRQTAWGEFTEALRFIRKRPALVLLIGYFGLEKVLTGIVVILFTPFVLAAYSERALAIILMCGAAGMIVGSVLMGAGGSPRRKVAGMLAFHVLLGVAAVAGGVWTSVPMLGASAFVVMFCRLMMGGCNQTLWQHKAPPALQGRVFALHELLINAAWPLAAILGGLITEHCFKPWMLPGGLLADSVGAWIGVGDGRGAALTFIAVGVLTILLATAAMLQPALRRLEDEVPDAH